MEFLQFIVPMFFLIGNLAAFGVGLMEADDHRFHGYLYVRRLHILIPFYVLGVWLNQPLKTKLEIRWK